MQLNPHQEERDCLFFHGNNILMCYILFLHIYYIRILLPVLLLVLYTISYIECSTNYNSAVVTTNTIFK